MNLTNLPYGMLYGRPVIQYEFMADFGSKGDILFADFSTYATLTKAGKAGLSRAQSIHVRFLFEEVAFRWSTRIDGRSHWMAPIQDLQGDTTRSPYVTLASRSEGATSSGL